MEITDRTIHERRVVVQLSELELVTLIAGYADTGIIVDENTNVDIEFTTEDNSMKTIVNLVLINYLSGNDKEIKDNKRLRNDNAFSKGKYI